MEVAKRIPYGISNFVEVVEQNQYYVDKTMYLPMLEEQPSNLFFIRPRRFGPRASVQKSGQHKAFRCFCALFFGRTARSEQILNFQRYPFEYSEEPNGLLTVFTLYIVHEGETLVNPCRRKTGKRNEGVKNPAYPATANQHTLNIRRQHILNIQGRP